MFSLTSRSNVVGIINNVVTPYMLNPTAWNWQNKAGFFWAGLCFLCLVYTYFRVPEPRGRTFAELDVLFEHKVTARQFEKTKVNVFEEEVAGEGVINNYQSHVTSPKEKGQA